MSSLFHCRTHQVLFVTQEIWLKDLLGNKENFQGENFLKCLKKKLLGIVLNILGHMFRLSVTSRNIPYNPAFQRSNITRMYSNLSQNLEKSTFEHWDSYKIWWRMCHYPTIFLLYAFTLDLPICIYFLYRINFSLIQELFYLLDREEDLIWHFVAPFAILCP